MENAERRVELIRMLRLEQKDNIGRIQRREKILYPEKKLSYCDHAYQNAKSYGYHEDIGRISDIDSVSPNKSAGFYMRILVSIGLFLLFFYMDINQTTYFGLTSDMIHKMVSDTFDLKSFAFMK